MSTITATRWVVVLLRAIAPDGTWLTTAGRDRRVRIWDRASGTCSATLTGHSESVWSVAIAPDGTWLTTASGDGRVRIWDRASGTCSATLTGHTSSVLSVAIAPDGAWLATGGHDRTVRIWDVAGQRTVGVARLARCPAGVRAGPEQGVAGLIR
ncbi:WD40 repeat domain-containing protein [Streptomyces sp. 900105755]